MSRPYAEVIGDPIAQSKSPLIHNFWLEKLGIDAEYRACHVRPVELADYFSRRRGDAEWRGCNITMPHKQAVIPLLDAIDPAAARIGAVNTVVPENGGFAGYNTDLPGFLEPLGEHRFDVVSVVGAGGAARAILAALADRGVRWISLQNRSIDKGEALLAEFGLDGFVVAPGEEVPTAELLVNTSSLGMAGYPPMPPVERFVMDGGIVYDIVTHPLDTELLRRARGRGLRTIDGLAMLIGQAAVAFEKFFGQPAPREHDAELRARLTA
ncbi:MAG TPA: shikimate dehydrogenase [Novosphingobium sp.]|nr:shikimate dehydrogenase [Novosphingobium sp.]HNN55133.1 shikimate dehydrogenase [Novosphingobium sp.]